MLFDQIIAISHYPCLLALLRSARERSSSSAPALGPLCFKRDHQQFRFPFPMGSKGNGNGKRRSPVPIASTAPPLLTPSVRDIGTALPDAGLRPLHLIMY
jgi:hypothetical protein